MTGQSRTVRTPGHVQAERDPLFQPIWNGATHRAEQGFSAKAHTFET
jgi:hypothetical protein